MKPDPKNRKYGAPASGDKPESKFDRGGDEHFDAETPGGVSIGGMPVPRHKKNCWQLFTETAWGFWDIVYGNAYQKAMLEKEKSGLEVVLAQEKDQPSSEITCFQSFREDVTMFSSKLLASPWTAPSAVVLTLLGVALGTYKVVTPENCYQGDWDAYLEVKADADSMIEAVIPAVVAYYLENPLLVVGSVLLGLNALKGAIKSVMPTTKIKEALVDLIMQQKWLLFSLTLPFITSYFVKASLVDPVNERLFELYPGAINRFEQDGFDPNFFTVIFESMNNQNCVIPKIDTDYLPCSVRVASELSEKFSGNAWGNNGRYFVFWLLKYCTSSAVIAGFINALGYYKVDGSFADKHPDIVKFFSEIYLFFSRLFSANGNVSLEQVGLLSKKGNVENYNSFNISDLNPDHLSYNKKESGSDDEGDKAKVMESKKDSDISITVHPNPDKPQGGANVLNEVKDKLPDGSKAADGEIPKNDHLSATVGQGKLSDGSSVLDGKDGKVEDAALSASEQSSLDNSFIAIIQRILLPKHSGGEVKAADSSHEDQAQLVGDKTSTTKSSKPVYHHDEAQLKKSFFGKYILKPTEVDDLRKCLGVDKRGNPTEKYDTDECRECRDQLRDLCSAENLVDFKEQAKFVKTENAKFFRYAKALQLKNDELKITQPKSTVYTLGEKLKAQGLDSAITATPATSSKPSVVRTPSSLSPERQKELQARYGKPKPQ